MWLDVHDHVTADAPGLGGIRFTTSDLAIIPGQDCDFADLNDVPRELDGGFLLIRCSSAVATAILAVSALMFLGGA